MGAAISLPASFASFVGRERQVDLLVRLLGAHRLVTLAGAPGVGKTRLAVHLGNQVLPQYADGVWLIDLASLEDPMLVASATARVLGVREADRSPIDALLEELRVRDCLLILDNCEHLVDACAAMTSALLMGCAGVRVLATSRQALGLTGEIAWRVPPLTVPGLPDGWSANADPSQSVRSSAPRPPAADLRSTLLGSEAGQLFVDRARAARASFEVTEANTLAIMEICRRVDGIPLALELAAARIGYLAPRQIADRLDDRFRLLARDRSSPMPRHDTLRSLVDWSHDLLSDAERSVFRRVAVFAGGWTLEAAEAVCGEDALHVLGQLVDKSLVTVAEQPSALRYSLHETLRHYALERLAEHGETATVRRLHAEYFLTLAEDAQHRLFGTELQPLLEMLDREHDNFRSALRWSIESGENDVGPLLAGALWRFWQVRGYLREGRAWLERLLTTARPSEPTSGRARALNAIGFLAFLQGDYEIAHPLLMESVEIRRTRDDRRDLVESLTNLGVLLRCLGNRAGAREVLEEARSVSRALGDRAWEGRTLNKLARLTFYEGDLVTARALHEQALALVDGEGNAWDVAIALGDLADVTYALGDHATARRHYADSLRLWQELGDERVTAQCLEGFAILASADGQSANVVRLLAAARAIRERITEPSSPNRRASLKRLLDMAQADLGEHFAVEWATGHATGPAEAVTLALTDPEQDLQAGTAQADAAQIASARSATSILSDAGDGAADDLRLTGREREVAVLIMRGLTNRRIATELVVSERTVEWHVSNILSRFGLRSRAQLALWARDHGITSPE